MNDDEDFEEFKAENEVGGDRDDAPVPGWLRVVSACSIVVICFGAAWLAQYFWPRLNLR